MKTIPLLITSGLLAASGAQAQLTSAFNVTHVAQTVPQEFDFGQSDAVTVTPQRSDNPVQGGTADDRRDFDALFGCDAPASRPLLSAFALHGIRLGDVCAQPALTSGEPAAMVRRVENSMRHLAPALSIAITQLNGLDSTITVATVRAAGRPVGLAKSVVIEIEEHVDATDATRSLQPGNAFRVALEQRYGKPAVVIGARDRLAMDHERTQADVRNRARASGIDSEDVIARSIDVEDERTRTWVACHPADTVYELHWTNPDGTVLTAALADGECGASPSFDLSLTPNPALRREDQFIWAQWIDPVIAFGHTPRHASPASAPTPEF
ncbi:MULTISPECIES: hypothetical protein [Paraburkholderia]|uniref:hypothetical protein n=1 Tax=Paraburkholderia TaxID=1822464 RepID=UPI00224F5538|nr:MULTISPECIES: hypothetical protein [Paraburkholderia]MCX4166314.1 hypothetical protein [Paraburkholderia megapolitana]MDN7161804.1 hypothetical protein [Paraburkholderia sp. CHISQ3]MDQ6498852.1 hypothetical protein [Paraburkholderia megapolitana]